MVRLALPLFFKFIVTHSITNNNLIWRESSDRRLRNTYILLIAFDKTRSVKTDKRGLKRRSLQIPIRGDRKHEKNDFLANGELFFLDLLSHRRPRLFFHITIHGFNQKMVVIGHQTITMTDPVKSYDYIIKYLKKILPILIVMINRLTRIPAGSYMVNCTKVFNP